VPASCIRAGTSCTTSSKAGDAGSCGPVGRGTLQYTAVWKAAQRLTARPVKFGTITPSSSRWPCATSTTGTCGGDLAISEALNTELRELVDAGL
jgi:5-methyltetrahydropteroyltriglutamate--homocysteine methyltransferase